MAETPTLKTLRIFEMNSGELVTQDGPCEFIPGGDEWGTHASVVMLYWLLRTLFEDGGGYGPAFVNAALEEIQDERWAPEDVDRFPAFVLDLMQSEFGTARFVHESRNFFKGRRYA